MTNSIDKRLQRKLEKHEQFLRDCAASDARLVAKRAKEERTWQEKQEGIARGVERRRAQMQRWHKRYFMAAGRWHPDIAECGLVPTHKMEARLRIEARRKAGYSKTRLGSGKRTSYVT